MATTITAGNSTNGAAAIAPDNTGILELKTGSGAGTTAMTIGTGQQVAVTLGSAAAPAITFAGDTNTGIFSPAADTIAFSEGGTEVARINSDAQIVTLAGTAALPVLTFTGDVNTGIYSPGADRIGFTEGGTQVGEFDASGNFLFNSGYGSVATAYGCRAWVNFNGTTNVGGFCTIRGSGNVTSVADNSTGNYSVNITNALPDTNYCVALGIQAQTAGVAGLSRNITSSVSLYRFLTTDAAGGALDAAYINVAIFR
jgi:hypothetical protein